MYKIEKKKRNKIESVKFKIKLILNYIKSYQVSLKPPVIILINPKIRLKLLFCLIILKLFWIQHYILFHPNNTK